MTAPLLELGVDVDWTDADAAAAARARARAGSGRLADLVEWLAATEGRFPPSLPSRARCIVVGSVEDSVAELADSLQIGVRGIDVPADPTAAFTAGTTAADDEVDAGADLVVLAADDATNASAVAVGLLTGAEPVALLPRGAAAVDTRAWVVRAEDLRDARRRVAPLRSRPDEFLMALESPMFAAAVGFVLRAAGRRTPLILDGTGAVAAALFCFDIQTRVARWWQFADTSTDRIHQRVVDELTVRPLLDLGTSRGDGTAGLLAVAVLRAAATTSGAGADE
ncbi:MAG: nicotinate-nucleotide--dimethylbenzimidazole phosphoribosyltransferase [Pseudonocardiales bacterium]|nr:nicotinate-nucleotide--dimethylbenzimidazole phosphoribosyltransferase [Pseudonocardiales bacterium]